MLPLSSNSTGSPFTSPSIEKYFFFLVPLHGLSEDLTQILSPVTLHLQRPDINSYYNRPMSVPGRQQLAISFIILILKYILKYTFFLFPP